MFGDRPRRGVKLAIISAMKPIATDIYTFSNLIERKCLYVDKTGILLPFFGETGGKQFFFPVR